MVTIEVDEDVFEALKARAEPFVDTPNTVLRRELGLGERGADEVAREARPPLHVARPSRTKRGRAKAGARSVRAPAGSLLPESEYVDPMLRVLAEKGGRAPAREVIEGVGAIVHDRLTPLDREKMASGAIRWQNRVQFTRLRMIDQGLLKRGSPRGVWEITDAGLRRIADADAA